MFTHYKKFFKHLRFHRYCNNDYLVQNNVINLKKDPLYFNQIPVINHEKVLKLMPKYFFTVHSLEKLINVKMNTNLFKTHFEHIPLYYMENDKHHTITWCPLKLLHTQEWVNCKSIYPIFLNENDNVIIRINSIDTKSYTIRHVNMINYFYLCDI
jgi:hypothetical protein